MTALQLVGNDVAGAPFVPTVEVFCGSPETPHWHVAISWAHEIYKGPTQAVVISWEADGQVMTLPSERWDVFKLDVVHDNERISVISPPFLWDGRAAFFDRLRAGDKLTIEMNHYERTRETFNTAGFAAAFAPVEDSCPS